MTTLTFAQFKKHFDEGMEKLVAGGYDKFNMGMADISYVSWTGERKDGQLYLSYPVPVSGEPGRYKTVDKKFNTKEGLWRFIVKDRKFDFWLKLKYGDNLKVVGGKA